MPINRKFQFIVILNNIFNTVYFFRKTQTLLNHRAFIGIALHMSINEKLSKGAQKRVDKTPEAAKRHYYTERGCNSKTAQKSKQNHWQQNSDSVERKVNTETSEAKIFHRLAKKGGHNPPIVQENAAKWLPFNRAPFN